MRVRTLSSLTGVALAAALACGVAFGGAVEVAKARPGSGTSMLTRGSQTTAVSSSTQFQEGDVVRVPTDGRLTIEFEDGSTVSTVGPTSLRMGSMDAKGRRIVLASGVVSEAKVKGVALEIQAPNPYDASFVLQNARGFARVNPGDRIVFQKLEGAFAKVWRGGAWTELGGEPWMLNLREAAPGRPSAPPAPGTGKALGPGNPQDMGNGASRFVLGERSITYYPASQFTVTALQNGGASMTFHGASDAYGVVEVGRDTVFFLADGETVEFNQNGDAERFDGISHMYPLFDQPIESPAELSPSLSKKR